MKRRTIGEPSPTVARIHKQRDEYRQTDPDSLALKLKLDLAQIVIRRLKELNWPDAELARKLGVSSRWLNDIINADANCSFDRAAHLLFALGLRYDDVSIVSPAPEESHEE